MFYDWTYMDVRRAASVGPLSVDHDMLLAIMSGRSVIADFPSDASFQMRADRPKDKKLIDSISNGAANPLVSPALRDFLLGEGIAELELLNVHILDHRGNVAADNYSLVHPCRVVDCIDQEKSEFKWNVLAPTTSMAPMSKLVLDESKLGDDDVLFRLRYIEHRILVREDLAKKFYDNQNFEGLWMSPIDRLGAG